MLARGPLGTHTDEFFSEEILGETSQQAVRASCGQGHAMPLRNML